MRKAQHIERIGHEQSHPVERDDQWCETSNPEMFADGGWAIRRIYSGGRGG